jgi:signal transduction histidine kinase
MKGQEMTKKQLTSELDQLRQRNLELERLEYDYKQTKEKLRIYQKQLRYLVSELLLTEERERRRLAGDLHDSISQSLAFSKIELDKLRKSLSSSFLDRQLNKISELITQAIQQIRTMIFELSPPVLYDIGLAAAIEHIANKMQKQFGIHIYVTEDKQRKELAEDLCVLVFRAVQELLFNVIKHAQAQQVNISITRNDQNIKVCVEDDGIGFDTVEIDLCLDKKERYGLYSIKERLQHVNGRFNIVSKPGQGARIIISVPVEQHAKKGRGEKFFAPTI